MIGLQTEHDKLGTVLLGLQAENDKLKIEAENHKMEGSLQLCLQIFMFGISSFSLWMCKQAALHAILTDEQRMLEENQDAFPFVSWPLAYLVISVWGFVTIFNISICITLLLSFFQNTYSIITKTNFVCHFENGMYSLVSILFSFWYIGELEMSVVTATKSFFLSNPNTITVNFKFGSSTTIDSSIPGYFINFLKLLFSKFIIFDESGSILLTIITTATRWFIIISTLASVVLYFQSMIGAFVGLFRACRTFYDGPQSEKSKEKAKTKTK